MRAFRLFAVSFFLVASLQAQWAASGSFVVGVPQGDFAANVGQNGYGVLLAGAFAPPVSPLRLGLVIGLMNYGSDDRKEPFSTTIPDVTVDVTTNNNIFIINAEGRLQPNLGLVRPYLGLTFGASILNTETSIKNTSSGEEIASSSNQSDVAFNYGAGAGVEVRLWRSTPGSSDTDSDVDVRDVSITLGGRYLRGGEAEYLKKGSIRNVGGKAVYDVLRSRTDIILYSLGVSVTF